MLGDKVGMWHGVKSMMSEGFPSLTDSGVLWSQETLWSSCGVPWAAWPWQCEPPHHILGLGCVWSSEQLLGLDPMTASGAGRIPLPLIPLQEPACGQELL